ncbi:MAG: methylthioribulose 1-phosphate dehydratase [Leptospiraceae bacterium]|nr:methylthioribulose 1-phosphate dehydratase [Leptospiraceae bacterium]
MNSFPVAKSAIYSIKHQICALCRGFYQQGWASGTGGGISIRTQDRIFMAPSGVEKEKIEPDDIFELDLDGSVLQAPVNKDLRLSECAPLFMAAYELRSAGAVLHSHSLQVVLATMLATPAAPPYRVIEFSELEMIKGLPGHGYHDTFRLPVIPNTARERDLTASLRQAILDWPDTCAVAVQNHGIYVWGANASKAKTQAECIDYLCQVLIEKRRLGLHQ